MLQAYSQLISVSYLKRTKGDLLVSIGTSIVFDVHTKATFAPFSQTHGCQWSIQFIHGYCKRFNYYISNKLIASFLKWKWPEHIVTAITSAEAPFNGARLT